MLTPIRQSDRKDSERRNRDRRQVDFEFGSAQWIKYVKKKYVAWPKEDRRQNTRRTGERRQNRNSDSPLLDYKSSRLTEEEEIFFDNLFKDQED